MQIMHSHQAVYNQHFINNGKCISVCSAVKRHTMPQVFNQEKRYDLLTVSGFQLLITYVLLSVLFSAFIVKSQTIFSVFVFSFSMSRFLNSTCFHVQMVSCFILQVCLLLVLFPLVSLPSTSQCVAPETIFTHLVYVPVLPTLRMVTLALIGLYWTDFQVLPLQTSWL